MSYTPRRYSHRSTDPVSKTEAVGVALLLIDYELETPQIDPVPKSWHNDLQGARRVLVSMLEELHPPPAYEDHPLKSNFGMVGAEGL